METVKALLDMGANVDECDERGSTALMTAAQWGHVDVCRLLLERGADVNKSDKQGDTALHEAARSGELAIVDWLLAHGADPNAFDAYGTTPLRVAAIKGDEMGIINKDIIETLIKAGAVAKMDEQYTQWLKDHPEAQSPAPPELAGEEL